MGETANLLQTPFNRGYFTWRLRGIALCWKILFACEHVILQFCTIELKTRVILVWGFSAGQILTKQIPQADFPETSYQCWPLEHQHNCTGDSLNLDTGAMRHSQSQPSIFLKIYFEPIDGGLCFHCVIKLPFGVFNCWCNLGNIHSSLLKSLSNG